MSWLDIDELVDLYMQRDHERAYWIDVGGRTHFMGDMETSYLCNVMRFVSRNRHMNVARNATLLKQQLAIVGSFGRMAPSEMAEEMISREMDMEFEEVAWLAARPWEAPLVAALTLHIETRAWEAQQVG